MILHGQIQVKDYGESDDVVFLSGMDEPLAQYLEEEIMFKCVTVRYWITDAEVSLEDAQEAAVRQLYGDFRAEFCARYSELTGYLWTDEELKVGGHDLLNELYTNKGKWIILEISCHGLDNLGVGS